jgi:hypothetical protein
MEVRTHGITGPLVGALVILNALDIVTTMHVLAAGGTEGNPVMAPIVESPWRFILVKALALGAVAIFVDGQGQSRTVRTALWTVVLVYSYVVLHNLGNLAAV